MKSFLFARCGPLSDAPPAFRLRTTPRALGAVQMKARTGDRLMGVCMRRTGPNRTIELIWDIHVFVSRLSLPRGNAFPSGQRRLPIGQERRRARLD
jgi:hypothetical protein